MPDRALTVVIVAYGVPGLLAECLAVLDRTHPVIVVDNSSSAEVRALVTEVGARYLDPECNLGFAAGVNRALDEIDLADTDVLLLNPDSTIDPASIERLRARLAEGPRLACVAPEQRQHGSTVELRVAWPFPTPVGAWIEAIGLGALRRTAFATGAVLLLRGDALVEVGGFDERFFLYAEETDWQRRARRLGWGTAVCKGVWATHVGAATDRDPARRELRFHAGAERYVRKHHGSLGWMSYRLASFAGATARAVVLTGARRRSAATRSWIYACGPDRLSRKRGAVPAPVPRVPELSGYRRATDVAPPSTGSARPSPPLRILLDARDVGINRKGVGRVLEELVPRLMLVDPGRYIAVVTPAAKTRFAAVDPARLRTVRLFPQSVWEQLVLPLVAALLRVDATYCHRECAAIWGPPVLLHVTEDPEVRWERQLDPDRRERARRRYSRFFMDRSLQRARVLTSSHSTRTDLVSRHGLRTEQVGVVALGVDLERFTSSASVGSRASSYFFCLASADPRDHCELVLQAFAKFRSGSNDAVRLVIGGDLGAATKRVEAMLRRLGVGALVDLPGWISDEQLSAYYAGALATICASSDEGFGLQPLEALASGSLLIAARTPAVEEVTAGAVVIWTDLEVGMLAAAMSTALSSPPLREEAAKTNPAVAARFDWSSTATKLHQLLEEFALAGPRRRRLRRTVERTGSL
jgi:GT2 family glycosyltransferase/glycosyltransferase involved in cell wall biosynthesis